MNSNGTTYQNGRFVNVDEVHNNTKNMTLSGFNQEGGTVTGLSLIHISEPTRP